MKVYLVRHGEPSYTPCTQRHLKGQGRDLAALNDDGINQILTTTMPLLIGNDAQIILTSPYTRALQSAAIIAAKTGLLTKSVHDLHEWIPDLTFNYTSYKELKAIYQNFYDHKGIKDEATLQEEYAVWEDLETFRDRVNSALLPYYGLYSSVIVVAHGMVIQSLCGRHIGYGEVFQMEFHPDMKFPEWQFTAPKIETHDLKISYHESLLKNKADILDEQTK